MLSWPLFETITNLPDWWTQILPQVFIDVGKALGMVLMDWMSVKVDCPLYFSNDFPSFAAWDISFKSALFTEKTATVELSSFTT
mmetsp:Transcript_16345/g.22416  ORF Transcript_16345/g.22416 Transcript_16345/m.22416 type:complete len:84 (-) Transcript_16345:937-1188(-)